MGNIISRSNAEALIPAEYSNEIIKSVSRESAALSLMKRLPNMTRKQRNIPVLQSLPVAGFVNGDNGLKAVSNVEWGNKVITAEEIAVIIPIPEAVLEYADYDIWAEIKPLIVAEFGRVIDGAVFFGTDKPTSWPAGIVSGAVAASKTVALGTGLPRRQGNPYLPATTNPASDSYIVIAKRSNRRIERGGDPVLLLLTVNSDLNVP